MKIGEIVLIPFPFADAVNVKVRPAIVICETGDKYKDLVLVAISSVVPKLLSKNEFILTSDKTNNLRTNSVVKVDRIVTLNKNEYTEEYFKTVNPLKNEPYPDNIHTLTKFGEKTLVDGCIQGNILSSWTYFKFKLHQLKIIK